MPPRRGSIEGGKCGGNISKGRDCDDRGTKAPTTREGGSGALVDSLNSLGDPVSKHKQLGVLIKGNLVNYFDVLNELLETNAFDFPLPLKQTLRIMVSYVFS
ncbi:hypothetical protein VNO80_16300 [Phaseolus coccineus]|uniref:Uncharacterized protein n=1 Tax=Phaseolus coccineus TaxID=3886 RepID=A0AAN9R3S9_PHACN